MDHGIMDIMDKWIENLAKVIYPTDEGIYTQICVT